MSQLNIYDGALIYSTCRLNFLLVTLKETIILTVVTNAADTILGVVFNFWQVIFGQISLLSVC